MSIRIIIKLHYVYKNYIDQGTLQEVTVHVSQTNMYNVYLLA